MNTDKYNRAIEQLVLYRRMAVLSGRGTPAYTSYNDKLEAGIYILAIAYDKYFDKVKFDVFEAYDLKYC